MALRTEETYNSEDFASVMGYLYREFGADVFGNAARMYGVFCDLAPKLKPYGNIARQVVARGLLTELGQAVRAGDGHRQARVMLKTRDFLENELLLGADRVSYFLTVFETLYGVTTPDVAQPAPPTPDSQQPAPPPVPQVPPTSGRSGLLTWKLDSAGLLTISGNGDMDDFTPHGYHQSNTPWSAKQPALTEVVIRNGVTGIGNEAFCYCTNLKRVQIPDSVTRIGYMAFRGCSGLQNVTIPNGVSEIELSVFENCTGLTGMKIPRGVIRIQGYAFSECRNLTSVTIPSSVRHIGYRAFWGCANLKRVYIPKGTSLDADSFGFNTEIIRTDVMHW